MELQMFAASPISNPVIPSFNTIIAYPIKPVYPIAVLSTKPYTKSATKKEKPIFACAGTFFVPKNGAIYTKQDMRTNINISISKLANENVYSNIDHPNRDTY